MTMQTERPVRVQSVLRGPTEAACLQQAYADGQQAAAHGYVPVWQAWGREPDGMLTLTILYDLAPPGSVGTSQPAPGYVPPAQPAPATVQPPVPAATAQPSIGSRAVGAIVSIVVIVIAALILGAVRNSL